MDEQRRTARIESTTESVLCKIIEYESQPGTKQAVHALGLKPLYATTPKREELSFHMISCSGSSDAEQHNHSPPIERRKTFGSQRRSSRAGSVGVNFLCDSTVASAKSSTYGASNLVCRIKWHDCVLPPLRFRLFESRRHRLPLTGRWRNSKKHQKQPPDNSLISPLPLQPASHTSGKPTPPPRVSRPPSDSRPSDRAPSAAPSQPTRIPSYPPLPLPHPLR